jgi:hypothetical protein
LKSKVSWRSWLTKLEDVREDLGGTLEVSCREGSEMSAVVKVKVL